MLSPIDAPKGGKTGDIVDPKRRIAAFGVNGVSGGLTNGCDDERGLMVMFDGSGDGERFMLTRMLALLKVCVPAADRIKACS